MVFEADEQRAAVVEEADRVQTLGQLDLSEELFVGKPHLHHSITAKPRHGIAFMSKLDTLTGIN